MSCGRRRVVGAESASSGNTRRRRHKATTRWIRELREQRAGFGGESEQRERIGYLIVRERMGSETKRKGVEYDLV